MEEYFVIRCERYFYPYDSNKGEYVEHYYVETNGYMPIVYTNEINKAKLFKKEQVNSFMFCFEQNRDNTKEKYFAMKVKRETALI